LLQGHPFSALKAIGGITIGAAKVTPCKPDENKWDATQGSLSLEGVKDLGDENARKAHK
jgi:hypothetical protein